MYERLTLWYGISLADLQRPQRASLESIAIMSNTTASSTAIRWEPPANGIVGGYTGDDINILRVMTAFAAIAWYNCAELFFLIPLRFKRCSGLYFWSLMVTNTAVLVYQIGSWCNMNNITEPMLTQTFQNLGW